MDIQKTNKELLNLYVRQYEHLAAPLKENNNKLKHPERATNPLLIQIDKKYASADLKIMIFGQETNTWLGEQNNAEFLGEIEPVYNLYEKFFLSNNCYSYGGQFWNGIKRFTELTEKQTNQNVGIVWNNLFKIGKCSKGTPFKSIQDIQMDNFNVIQQEIELLKPDVLIFFSGPNYDNQIKRTFGNLNKQPLAGFNERQLCKLENLTNIPAFRTYHPNYLWRNNINSYLEPLVEQITTMHNNV